MESERLDIEKTLQALTLEEKLRMLTGSGMWHTYAAAELPGVRMADGPNGVRMTDGAMLSAVPATCFPTLSVLANTWNPALIYNVGAAIGKEATALGVNVLLAPGVNIKRTPYGGRNFEYFSEDPFLSGTLGKAYIEGVQSTGVGACVKHFAANNTEVNRMYTDSVVDERALRELYLKPFEIASAAQPAAFMCAYNKLNGTYCAENPFLLKTVLRDDWNFRGLTVSDWGAVHDRATSLAAGLDLEMPDSLGAFDARLTAALDSGEITMDMIDSAVRRTLELIDNVYLEPYGDFDADEHDRLAYNAAADGIVLLKNDNNFLPLTKDMRVAIMGAVAENAPVQGGGSSHVTALKTMSPLDAFTSRAIEVAYYKGYSPDPKENDKLLEEALAGACVADAVVVFAAPPAPQEGLDRETLALPPEQEKLISALTNGGHRVVVVLMSPGPVLMPWVRRVRSIVYTGLAGSGAALATADILYGRVNPKGRLAETFPADESKEPDSFRNIYRESLFVGYKYYEKTGKDVLFPFGHGLSFSEVEYTDIEVKRQQRNRFDVKVTLLNRSARDAYETVQVYVADRTGRVLRPEKQLAGYFKTFVEGKTSATVTIRLDERAFEFWNPETKRFSLCDGEYKIIVAASAADIKSEVSVNIDGDFKGKLDYPDVYDMPLKEAISDMAFAELYGAPLPPELPRPIKGEFTLDSCIADFKKTLIGRIMASAVKRRAARQAPAGAERDALVVSAMTTPLTVAASMSDGALSQKTARGIVEMANGKYFKGIKTMLSKKA